ncbi:MAG TPA: DUF2884 family protein [Rhodanobacter sp.]
MSRLNWMGASLIGAVVLTGLLAGCDHDSDINIISSGNSNLVNGGIRLHDGLVTLHAKGSPDATISATGDLGIDQHAVEVNANQRSLLQQYYRNAAAVRQHGIETGKAGAAIAGQAISSVAKGIAKGDTDQIDKEIDAKTAVVTQTALKICGDLAGIKTAQDALASQLPAFKPYAAIVDAGAVIDCEKDAKD